MMSFFSFLKEARTQLGLTQMDLAKRSNISLPTIQNIEANHANPSLETLQALAESLGLELNLKVKGANWDLLTSYGVPLVGEGIVPKFQREVVGLVQNLREACLELGFLGEVQDRERKQEAIQSFLLALQSHFPSVYKKYCQSSPAILQLMPVQITGRHIKLRRIALAALATYL